MARINRTDVIQKAVNDLALNVSVDKIPNEILDKVQLVYGLNRHFSNFLVSGTQSTSGNLSVSFPTTTKGDIYLTSVTASFAKDATCDVGTGRITVSITPDNSNISTPIISFAVITLTADSQTVTYSLPYPIKIKEGSSLVFGGTFTVGVMTRNLSAMGFTNSSN